MNLKMNRFGAKNPRQDMLDGYEVPRSGRRVPEPATEKVVNNRYLYKSDHGKTFTNKNVDPSVLLYLPNAIVGLEFSLVQERDGRDIGFFIPISNIMRNGTVSIDSQFRIYSDKQGSMLTVFAIAPFIWQVKKLIGSWRITS